MEGIETETNQYRPILLFRDIPTRITNSISSTSPWNSRCGSVYGFSRW